MKTRKNRVGWVLMGGLLIAMSGCSSVPGQTAESPKEMADIGPTVMNARAEPSTVELNRDLKAVRKPEVLADVKDFHAKVSDVKLKFKEVPISVPMENIGGTTWRAELSQQQLQMLAVSGKTIKYDASVVAKDQKGQVAQSAPITVAVKAPELSKSAG